MKLATPLAAVLATLLALPAAAQIEQGRLTGIITDPQGTALPGVTVTAHVRGADRIPDGSHRDGRARGGSIP